jgi:FtsH-binding integral membrane protein
MAGPTGPRPRNGRDYAGIVAVILATGLMVVLILACFSLMILDRPISESAARLLTTIGAGLVGALATYVGTAGRRRDNRNGPR